MTDSEFTMFVFLWIFGGIIILQSIRLLLLRRKFEKLALKTVGVTNIADLPPKPRGETQNSEELVRIRQRLQVLERIATDQNGRLDEELEALRRS